jgi:alcohol dehydrogenase-like protein
VRLGLPLADHSSRPVENNLVISTAPLGLRSRKARLPQPASAAATKENAMPRTMQAAVFVEKGRIALRDKPVPEIGPLDALLRITTTTICGTDIHILKGEYPVAPGLTIGHEPVGIIERLALLWHFKSMSGLLSRGYADRNRFYATA